MTVKKSEKVILPHLFVTLHHSLAAPVPLWVEPSGCCRRKWHTSVSSVGNAVFRNPEPFQVQSFGNSPFQAGELEVVDTVKQEVLQIGLTDASYWVDVSTWTIVLCEISCQAEYKTLFPVTEISVHVSKIAIYFSFCIRNLISNLNIRSVDH